MAASKNLSQVLQSHNSNVARHGVIALSGYGINLRVDRGHLLFEDGVGEDRRRGRFPRVKHGLRRLVVIGTDGVISLSAIRWLADQKVSMVVLERDGSVLATTGRARSSDARLRRAQALGFESGAALKISRELIDRKLAGQAQVAREGLTDSDAAAKIVEHRSSIAEANTLDDLRLIEARAALVYWSAWKNVSISFPRQDLVRVPSHWQTFGSRVSPLTGSPRLAANPVNAMLNYLYAILEAESRLAAATVGLDPTLGVLHVDTSYRDNLACDLMEPIRPEVDSFVLDWIKREPLSRNWFFEQRDGNCRLMDPFAVRLAETAPTWARLVAPFAEWVAHLFSSQGSRSKYEAETPTPLTQRRRSEGRGNRFKLDRVAVGSPRKVCRFCGKELNKGKHCSACRVIASRENMQLALMKWHATPKTSPAKKRAFKRMSEHAVALTWWSPASQPLWLTEKFYVEKIQPRLPKLRVSDLASTLKISKSYAALIRSDKKRPHPRHWQTLAKLVGLNGH